MKKEVFLKGILALALVFGLILVGCENGTQQVDVGSMPKIPAPKVTAEKIDGGILLSWPKVVEATGYRVWRDGKGYASPIQLTGQQIETKDGVVQYFDIVGYNNDLQENTDYTYTVQATALGSAALNFSKWEKKVKTGAFPAQGSKPEQPTANFEVTYVGEKSVEVTITPPASGVKPNAYWIYLEKDGKKLLDGWSLFNPAKDAVIKVYGEEYGTEIERGIFKALELRGGEFKLTVQGQLGGGDYFGNAENVVVEKKYDALFGGGSRFTANLEGYEVGNTSSTEDSVAALYTKLNLTTIKAVTGVTYTVQKVVVVDGKEGNPETVTLSRTDGKKDDKTQYASVANPLTVDFLGNLSATTLYELNYPTNKVQTIRYRIQASKAGSESDVLYARDYDSYYGGVGDITDVEIDPREFLEIELSFFGEAIAGAKTDVKVNANANLRNLLQTGDTLTVYYSDENQFPFYSETTRKVSFNVAELEKTSGGYLVGTTQTLVTHDNVYTGDKKLYVYAVLKGTDGYERTGQGSGPWTSGPTYFNWDN